MKQERRQIDLKNFCIAAVELEGTRKGMIFQDTDLYKWLESEHTPLQVEKAGSWSYWQMK